LPCRMREDEESRADGDARMRITTTQPLFAWEALEDSPSLRTLRELPACIPDAPLLNSLRQARGKGRDDYPVSALWGTLLLTIALRRFPPIPRATKQFERKYKGRTAVERINARVKLFWGADDGNITGASRFHGFLGTVMVVHAGFATLLASAGRRDPAPAAWGTMKLSVVAKALRAKTTA